MKIEEIAKIGKEFYSTGKPWLSSTYKRTVLMRTAVDSLLGWLQQNLPEDESKMHVSAAVFKLATREEYAKKKDLDMYANKFVDAVVDYLKERNWFSVRILSSIEKELVDTYEFALISISKEGQK